MADKNGGESKAEMQVLFKMSFYFISIIFRQIADVRLWSLEGGENVINLFGSAICIATLLYSTFVRIYVSLLPIVVL